MAKKTKTLNIVKNDPWLAPFSEAIEGRHTEAMRKEKELCSQAGTLNDFANAHRYFGLHRMDDGRWVFREWAPNAREIYLIGDFSDWNDQARYQLNRLPGSNGVW